MGNCNEPEYFDRFVKDAEPSYGIRGQIIRDVRNQDIHKYYSTIRVLGEGSMGSVSEVVKTKNSNSTSSSRRKAGDSLGWRNWSRTNVTSKTPANHSKYAMKSIILDRVSQEFIDEMRNEIDILKTLDHPNIVKAYETFENRHRIYIVMELCSGGDLYERTPYNERDAAKIVTKILSAVSYMHKQNVVHRDLKFENIMFESARPDAEIKILDFGLSKKFLQQSKRLLPQDYVMTEGVGTIYTMAPQVLQGIYTSKADLWSVGVIAFMLLSSTKPFWGKNRRQIVDRIMRCKYRMDTVVWKHVSQEGKKFVKSLLRLDPKMRLDADQALQSAWLSQQYNLSDRMPNEKLMSEVKDQLITYANSAAFKKLTLMVIAHNSCTTQDLVKLRTVFDQYDSSNNGTITLPEFRSALAGSEFAEEDVKDIFEQLDLDKNGSVHYTEFIAATLEARGNVEEEKLADAFHQLDTDNTGFISRDNVRKVWGKKCTEEMVEMLFREADRNNDGKISYKELLNLFRNEKKRELKIACANLKSGLTSSSEDESLLDENAFVPGGVFDKDVSLT